MAAFDCFKLVYVLIFLTIDVIANSDMYTEYHIENDDICNIFGKKRELQLPLRSPDAAIKVKSTYSLEHWQHSITDKRCRFVIKAAKGEQLFAVIQNMSLRKNGSECLDYIQFKRKDWLPIKQICGKTNRHRVMSQETLDFSEFDSEGEIETIIFISKIPLEKHEYLDLTIVYTPYKDCSKVRKNREEYKSFRNESVCLWNGYVCDGVQNCALPVCKDEDDCGQPEIVSNGTGTKVTIGAVTTILLCFVVFVMGLWICRKHKKLCWSSDCAGPRTDSEFVSELARSMATSTHQRAADSMLETATVSSGLDKDLPPSYDSLFPEQSNPSTT